MSTMKSDGFKKQNRKTAQKLSGAKKRGRVYSPYARWSEKERTAWKISGSASRHVVVRNSDPRSRYDAYAILSSQESRELDNAISTLRGVILEEKLTLPPNEKMIISDVNAIMVEGDNYGIEIRDQRGRKKELQSARNNNREIRR